MGSVDAFLRRGLQTLLSDLQSHPGTPGKSHQSAGDRTLSTLWCEAPGRMARFRMSPERNKGGRPRREIDTTELLRLRAEGCSFPQIARRMGLGLGTVHRTYHAATNATVPFQNAPRWMFYRQGESNTGPGYRLGRYSKRHSYQALPDSISTGAVRAEGAQAGIAMTLEQRPTFTNLAASAHVGQTP